MPRGRTSNMSATTSNGTRGAKQTATRARFDDDDDIQLPASQDSQGSDDTEFFQLALAEHYIAEREKKNKDRRNQFISEMKCGLEGDLNNARISMEVVGNFYAKYNDFVLQYAAISDKIRNIWLEIQREQDVIRELSSTTHSKNNSTDKQREVGMISGIVKLKEVCEGLEEFSISIRPDT